MGVVRGVSCREVSGPVRALRPHLDPFGNSGFTKSAGIAAGLRKERVGIAFGGHRV